MKNDPLKRIVTPSMIIEYLTMKSKENEKINNILKTGTPFTEDDVEQLSKLPNVR
jgi:hypothetical protein